MTSIAPADLAACRALLANGSRTFLAASWLLPRSVRDAACALYAFCRVADDAVDQSGAGIEDAVASIRLRLGALYAGQPADHAADRALAVVVGEHGIAQPLLEALVEGFEWDADGRACETLDDLHAYAARVAGSVGAMMALLMGTRGVDELARACDLGVAMQLSNIARDVGEDARMGRLYLPRAWMREAGLDPDRWLAEPVHSAALGQVVRRVLDEADRLYERVGAGIARLPLSCRPGINVARRRLDAVTARSVVPGRRKARLLVMATMGALVPRPVTRRAEEGPLPATAFLVQAACARASVRRPASPRPWNIGARAVWTIELFDRLERRDATRSWHRNDAVSPEIAC